jgi:hypothetical protein
LGPVKPVNRQRPDWIALVRATDSCGKISASSLAITT